MADRVYPFPVTSIVGHLWLCNFPPLKSFVQIHSWLTSYCLTSFLSFLSKLQTIVVKRPGQEATNEARRNQFKSLHHPLSLYLCFFWLYLLSTIPWNAFPFLKRDDHQQLVRIFWMKHKECKFALRQVKISSYNHCNTHTYLLLCIFLKYFHGCHSYFIGLCLYMTKTSRSVLRFSKKEQASSAHDCRLANKALQ